MNIPDIQFDHDAPFVKHRKMGEGVTFEQDGVLFSSGYLAIKILRERAPKDTFDDMTPDELRAQLRANKVMPPPQKKKKAVSKKAVGKKVHSVRQLADDKLAGFRNEPNPDYIQKALSENHAAVMAEEQAE